MPGTLVSMVSGIMHRSFHLISPYFYAHLCQEAKIGQIACHGQYKIIGQGLLAFRGLDLHFIFPYAVIWDSK